jgi:hypothetical protein
MKIGEISKPVTAASLNEGLAKRFGTRVNVDSFTLEQLQDARNKIRTTLSQVETMESFDAVHKNNTYQKSKALLDVLNAAIAERAETPIEEETVSQESVVREGAEDQAEITMAAKDMVDRLTGWMEDTAEMQTESMLELADAIRDELGAEQSESFTALVKPGLEALYAAMEETRTVLTQGVGMLTGEGEAPEAMGAEDEMAVEPEMEPTVDAEAGAEADVAAGGMEDEFAASEPAAGGEEEAGRAKRESVERSRKLGQILSKKK